MRATPEGRGAVVGTRFSPCSRRPRHEGRNDPGMVKTASSGGSDTDPAHPVEVAEGSTPRWAWGIAGVIAAVPVVRMLLLVLQAHRLPYNDYWPMIDSVLTDEGGFDLGGLFELRNEHPIVVPKLLYWLNLQVSGGSNVAARPGGDRHRHGAGGRRGGPGPRPRPALAVGATAVDGRGHLPALRPSGCLALREVDERRRVADGEPVHAARDLGAGAGTRRPRRRLRAPGDVQLRHRTAGMAGADPRGADVGCAPPPVAPDPGHRDRSDGVVADTPR